MNLNPRPQIYFLKPVGADGPIKIGVSDDVRSRLGQYNKISPVPFTIVALVDVPDSGQINMDRSRLERRFHLRYADYRLHHEWFAPHDLILSDIAAINAGTFDIGELPAWQRMTRPRARRMTREQQTAGETGAERGEADNRADRLNAYSLHCETADSR